MLRRILDRPRFVLAFWSTGIAVSVLAIMKAWLYLEPVSAREWRIGEFGAIAATGAILVGWSIVSQKGNVPWFLALRIAASLTLTVLMAIYLLAGSEGIVLPHDLHVWFLPAGLVSLLIVLQSELQEFAMPMSWRIITFLRGLVMVVSAALIVIGLPWLLGQSAGDVPAAMIALLPRDPDAAGAGLQAVGVLIGGIAVLLFIAATGFRGSQHLVASVLPPWSDADVFDRDRVSPR